MKAATGGIYTR